MRERRTASLLLVWCMVSMGAWAASAHADDDQETQELKPSPRLGLSAAVFATDAEGPANNVSLMWATADASDQFEIGRATKKAGPYEKIYSGTGMSYKDYSLADGTYFYQLAASQSGTQVRSNIASITTMAMPVGLKRYSNETRNESGLSVPRTKVGNTYYDFQFVRQGRGLGSLLMRTSTDGHNWIAGGSVMDQNSDPELADCKFEAENAFYDSIHDQIVYWCHWERSAGYGSGKALVATAKPGGKFTVHHIYNPMGIQVRDMNVFVDDDHQGYLVAASNMPGQGANATLTIFKMNATYDDAVEAVAKVMENGYREAPCIIKRDGYYYLTFSQAAGWYPSRGGYLSARSLKGPWSEPRSIGNPSTFSSQSGAITEYGAIEPRVPLMLGNRWIRGEGTSSQIGLPIHFVDGFAFADYSPVLLHDSARSVVVPLDMGRLLSQDRPAQCTIPGKSGHEISKAFDGDYFSGFASDEKRWPFEITTDLGGICNVRNVQISWFMAKGSEAFYTYRIEGSADDKNWTVLLDRSDASDNVISKTYGFSSDELPAGAQARYVKVRVEQAHLHNNPTNWYPPTVYQIKVFGEAVR